MVPGMPLSIQQMPGHRKAAHFHSPRWCLLQRQPLRLELWSQCLKLNSHKALVSWGVCVWQGSWDFLICLITEHLQCLSLLMSISASDIEQAHAECISTDRRKVSPGGLTHDGWKNAFHLSCLIQHTVLHLDMW